MDDLDLENREPCPDGRCVGVIGAEGRCGVCGMPNDAATEAPAAEPGKTDGRADAAEEALDLESRIPCSDGACVGILGANGRCGTCGQAAQPVQSAQSE